MKIDYDEFRRTTWHERVTIFNALSPDEKAELFRSQIEGWLERHRAELSDEQIALLEQAAALATPAMYRTPKPEHLVVEMKELERRAMDLLTPAQAIDALTMQWGLT